MIDIGANLTHRQFHGDLDAVLERAREAGVCKVLVTGTSLKSSMEAIALAHKHEGFLFATVGIHPHDANHANGIKMAKLKALLRDNPQHAVAVGECGLDFDRNFSSSEDQIYAFRAQLDLAVELDLPVFLHERCAFHKFVEIMTEYRPKLIRGGVVHCFTGTSEELDAYLALDLHIGITGWINDPKRGKELCKIVERIPIDRLMIET